MSVSRVLSIGAFLSVFVMVGAVEVAARRPESKVPTVGEFFGFVMRYRVGRLPVGRIAVFGFWWWLGWHFFAR